MTAKLVDQLVEQDFLYRQVAGRGITVGHRLLSLARKVLDSDSARTPVESWPDAAVVCTCTGVTCGALRMAHAAGARSSVALCERTGAGSVCGSCRPQVAELGKTFKVQGGSYSTIGNHAVRIRGRKASIRSSIVITGKGTARDGGGVLLTQGIHTLEFFS